MVKGGAGNSRRIQNIVFGVILILLFILVCRLFAPFFTVLLWSILLYIILKPLHQKSVVRFDKTTLKGKISRNALSLVFSVSTVIVLLCLLSFVVFQLSGQAIQLLRQAGDWLSSHSLNNDSIFDDISRVIRDLSSEQIIISADELRSQLLSYLNSGLQFLVRFSGQTARNVSYFLVNCFFMIFILFFFFMDGDYLAKLALRVIPIRKEYINAMVLKFKDVTKKLVMGYIIVALAQAIMAFIVFSIFRISGSLVFSVLIFFVAFVPIIGPTIIYIPLGIIRILNGDMLGGILIIIVSSAFISSIENFLRPFILRDRIQLHPLIIFFAILGGINVFGVNGIVLGPMVMIIFLTVVDLFLTEHKLESD